MSSAPRVSPIDSPDIEFPLPPTGDPETAETCAGPTCEASPTEHRHDLSLVLGCDIGGMAADYGTVAFCSVACAQALVELGTLQHLDALEEAGCDLWVLPGQPVVAHVDAPDAPEPLFSALGHDRRTALESVTEWVAQSAQSSGRSIDEYTIRFDRLS